MNNTYPLQTNLPLKYLAHAPSKTPNTPMIIFLHGYGSNEEDLFDLKDQFIPEYTYLSVRAPMELYQGSYQWFNLQQSLSTETINQIQNHTKLLEDFISQAAVKYQTSPDRILLVGFSQGAIMSYELALKKPEIVRGIIALSGRISPMTLSQVTPGLDLKKLAIFIGHGTKDDRIHVREALSAYEALSQTSITPEYHAYNGLGHSINLEELEDIRQWILKTL